jgi:hypothetical protein
MTMSLGVLRKGNFLLKFTHAVYLSTLKRVWLRWGPNKRSLCDRFRLQNIE